MVMFVLNRTKISAGYYLAASVVFTFCALLLSPAQYLRYLPSMNWLLDPNSQSISSVTPSGPIQDNGLTTQVQWDKYTLFLKGQRIFMHSGEFHTFRLPVPSLWIDILQKVKAAGLNAISVYTHMGLINPSRGVIDFNSYRDLKPLFDAAMQTGIWIVLRPGPYINAETSAGGIPHWITSEVSGRLRTNASDYRDAWMDYIESIVNVTVPYQITEGGPVIAVQVDNEHTDSPGTREYFAQLEDVLRGSNGSMIVVPLTYNDPQQNKTFVNGTGAVDIYGVDYYPLGFDCSNPTKWSGVKENYYDYHQNTNPSQPYYIPEFQGGAFDAWGPSAPGYDACKQLTGPDFLSVYNLHLWASNAKMINYYMLYGGTSWGTIPYPGVYTSYDYGASIAENRALTDKYAEVKRQGHFLRSSPEFYKTDWVGNSTAGVVSTSNPSALVTFLQNPDTKSGFYIARHTDSASRDTLDFQLTVPTSAGELRLPQVVSAIRLSGRQSKMIVTNYAFGSSRLLYSTAQIFFAGQIGGRDVLFIFGDADQEHELALKLEGVPTPQASSTQIAFKQQAGLTIISFLSGIEGFLTVWDSDKQLILYGDTNIVGTFWAPVIAPTDSADPFKNYWQLGTNDSILVGGPYLVRNASISGSELALKGDLKDGVRLFLIAPETISSITWNGQPVSTDVAASLQVTHRGGFVGDLLLQTAANSIPVPTLTEWKYADSLPEIRQDYSDERWVVANHTTTNIPFKPHYGDKVLYGCDYQFCEGMVLWRGHFTATGNEEHFQLSINGGKAFAASVWVNDVFIKTTYGNSTNNRNAIEETDETYTFPAGSLRPNVDNVVTVLQDNMGLKETGIKDTNKSPRGIRGFRLNGGNFTEWKVQGKVGGYTSFPDTHRGVFNEGGLFGERQGWHLPGFDASSWVERSLSSGLPNGAAGVGFFVTSFQLDMPDEVDAHMSFTFDQSTQPYRALLFVNGWMMGKRVANLGPQYKFPVHEGILDYHGSNTVAIALWTMDPNANVSPSLALTIDGVYEGGVGNVRPENPPWSSRGRV